MCYDLDEFNTGLAIDPNHAIPVFAFLWDFVHCLAISVKGSPNQVTLKDFVSELAQSKIWWIVWQKPLREELQTLFNMPAWSSAGCWTSISSSKTGAHNLYHTDSYKTPIIPYMQVSCNIRPCYYSLSGHSHLLPSRVVENREDMVFISWAKFCLQRSKYARGLQVQ